MGGSITTFHVQDEAKQQVLLQALSAYEPANRFEARAVAAMKRRLDEVLDIRDNPPAPKLVKRRRPAPPPAPKPAARGKEPEPFKHPALAVLEARGEVDLGASKPGECDCGAKLQAGRCVSCEALEARYAGR